MKSKGLRRLGCEVVPFSLASFEEFVGGDAAKELHEKALKSIRDKARSVKLDELKMIVGVRPDLFFAISFLIVGPLPYDERRERDFGCINLLWPNTTISTRQHGSAEQWGAVPTDMPPKHWRFLEG